MREELFSRLADHIEHTGCVDVPAGELMMIQEALDDCYAAAESERNLPSCTV